MNKIIILIFLGVLIYNCGESPTKNKEPEYHDIRYLVLSSGDTTYVTYKDENGENKSITIAHETRHQRWEIEFKAKEGSNLYISAFSQGDYIGGVRLVSASVDIFIDGGLVSSDEAYAYSDECNCFDPITPDSPGWCYCMVSASFAGILW